MRLTILNAIREAVSTAAASHTVHVSNLSWVTSKKQLFDHFSQFGKIKNVTLPLDQKFGVHRGYAFVDFEEEKSVKKAFAEGPIQQIDEADVRLSKPIHRSRSESKMSTGRTEVKTTTPRQRTDTTTASDKTEKPKENITKTAETA